MTPRETPHATSATAANSPAARSPAAMSAAMPPTCATAPTATPRARGGQADPSPVVARRSGIVTCVTPEKNAVPAATHSWRIRGQPVGMVRAKPVVVLAGRTDATSSGFRPIARPAKAVVKRSAGATADARIANVSLCSRRMARCECAYRPSVTMAGWTADINIVPAHSR